MTDAYIAVNKEESGGQETASSFQILLELYLLFYKCISNEDKQATTGKYKCSFYIQIIISALSYAPQYR